jgi:hypothetical protein
MLDVVYLLVDPSHTLDNSPVLQSQVLDWLSVQATNGVRAGVVSGVHDPRRFGSVVRPKLGTTVACETFPMGSTVAIISRAARSMKRLHSRYGTRAVYVRGIWGAVAYRFAFPFKGPRLVYDFRGDVVQEARYAGRTGLRLWLLERLTSWAIRTAHATMAVSARGAEVLRDRYRQGAAEVVPCCVDVASWERGPEVRASVRSALGIAGDETVLVYSGGFSRYQMIPEMLELWSGLEASDAGLRFLLLVNDTPTHLEVDLKRAATRRPQSLLVRTVPRAEVPGYLAASDIGFMMRERHPLNAVASPVKFGEYVSAGLAVVASPGLGDVDAAIRESDLGSLADPADLPGAEAACLELIKRVRGDRTAFKRRAQTFARARMDWQAYLPVWRRLIGMSI